MLPLSFSSMVTWPRCIVLRNNVVETKAEIPYEEKCFIDAFDRSDFPVRYELSQDISLNFACYYYDSSRFVGDLNGFKNAPGNYPDLLQWYNKIHRRHNGSFIDSLLVLHIRVLNEVFFLNL